MLLQAVKILIILFAEGPLSWQVQNITLNFNNEGNKILACLESLSSTISGSCFTSKSDTVDKQCKSYCTIPDLRL